MLCHTLLEEWAKGLLLPFELADVYKSRYNEQVKHYFPSFPPGIGLAYYQSGLKYFNRFEGFGGQHEIVAVEDRFNVLLDGYKIAGIIDLILRDKETGDLVVICHKSKSVRNMKKSFGFAVKQLYLYALGVEARYGKPPSLLRFNLFRDGKYIDEPFSKSAYEDTKQWMVGMISRIKADTEWIATPSDFHCMHACSCFPFCETAKIQF